MLILQRRTGESVRIGEDIEITVVATEGNKVRLAISAPASVKILRSELVHARDTNLDAAMEQSTPDELLHMLGDLLSAPHTTQTAPVIKLHLSKKTSEGSDD
ncbi:MAG: carbon storage regulator [Oscillospiraceae bacterium]|nr:carbon storage regulator [Oscillospiraceae bacterium]